MAETKRAVVSRFSSLQNGKTSSSAVLLDFPNSLDKLNVGNICELAEEDRDRVMTK